MKPLKHANLFIALNTYIRMLHQLMLAIPPDETFHQLRVEMINAISLRRKYRRAYETYRDDLKEIDDFLHSMNIGIETIQAGKAQMTWFRLHAVLNRQTL